MKSFQVMEQLICVHGLNNRTVCKKAQFVRIPIQGCIKRIYVLGATVEKYLETNLWKS